VGVFLFQGHVPDDRLGETILIVFCTAQLLSLLLAAYHVYTRFIKVEPFHLALFLPPGFWSFGLTITLSVIVVIILDNFDQAVVFSRFEISQLGIYRAALSTAEFVRWAPILLIRSIMPLFSHLLADGQHPQLRLLYHRTIKYNTLAASTIALTIILFSREIMGLFGSTYMQAESILVLLASSFVLSGISTVNSSFLVAKGRAELGLVSGIVGSVLQIAFSLILIRPLGIIGVVIGKIINLGCITVLEVWFVNRIAGLRPDRDTSGILGVLFLASMLSRYLQPESMAFVMIRNVILLTTFVALALRWLNQDDHYHLYSFGRGRFE
jgi:O-antigen/teichoic acid export membrane protein